MGRSADCSDPKEEKYTFLTISVTIKFARTPKQEADLVERVGMAGHSGIHKTKPTSRFNRR